MKKLLCLLSLLVLAGCATTAQSTTTENTMPVTQIQTTQEEIATELTISPQFPQNSNAEVVQREIEDIFYLGQSPANFFEFIEQNNIQLNETRLNPEDRHISWDGFFAFSSEDFRVWFNENEQMVRVNILTPKYVTSRGIRVGDSRERVFELYGTDFTNDPLEGFWYYYSYGDLTIGFLMGGGYVHWWNIFIPSDQPQRP